MLRLIYQNTSSDYQYFDSDLIERIEDTQAKLRNQGADVVCVVDYTRHFIFRKSKNYSYHRDFIDDLIFDPRYVTNY